MPRFDVQKIALHAAAFPSHLAHLKTGTSDGVFMATTCPA
jgi:hypothetical protein